VFHLEPLHRQGRAYALAYQRFIPPALLDLCGHFAELLERSKPVSLLLLLFYWLHDHTYRLCSAISLKEARGCILWHRVITLVVFLVPTSGPHAVISI
jgi:hypothetical protein